MGTLGGKVGFVTGCAVCAVSFIPISRSILGDCLFEQGCGKHEGLWLAVAFLAAIGVSVAVGLALRMAINGVIAKLDR